MKLGFTSKAIMKHEELMRLKNARVYISGKISGLMDLNKPKFEVMQNWLYFVLGTTIEVINPHTLLHVHDKKWTSYMKVDLRHMLACNMVVLLDDWQKSRGAICEVLIANLVHIPIYDIHNGDLRRINIGFWKTISLLLKIVLKLV